MAAAIPVMVAAGEGEMADLLRRSGGGWRTPPGDGAALAAEIQRVRGLPPAERKAVGASGRGHVQEQYWRPRQAAQVLEIFQGLVPAGAEATKESDPHRRSRREGAPLPQAPER
jgi:hypothetical protein